MAFMWLLMQKGGTTRLKKLRLNTPYCDLRGRIKGTARTLYPVYVERANMGKYCPDNIGHKAR